MTTASKLFVAEPPAAFAVRVPVVVDCSVMAAWLFREAQYEDALTHLRGKDWHAPGLVEFEFANVALKKHAAGADRALIEQALSRFQELPLALYRTDLPAQHALAVRYRLSGYDAAYLWLAGERRLPLLTFDAKLARAAREHLAGLT